MLGQSLLRQILRVDSHLRTDLPRFRIAGVDRSEGEEEEEGEKEGKGERGVAR